MVWQRANEAVDIGQWLPDEEFETYPQGAREKSAVYCPENPPYPFLVGSHRYLFKYPIQREVEQYWVEIAAYRIGQCMGIVVPPAHAAYDKDRRPGALIEWFYDYPNAQSPLEYTAAVSFLAARIPDYDYEKGTTHNFRSIADLCAELMKNGTLLEDWLTYWSKVLTFDALIGNVDRHQDNWGFLGNSSGSTQQLRFAPAFDNGSSMGYELPEHRFESLMVPDATEKYVARGRHHMRWALGDRRRAGHAELLLTLVETFPQSRHYVLTTLNSITPERIAEIIHELTKIDTYGPLSRQRANFMTHLLKFRYRRLSGALSGTAPRMLCTQ